MQNYLGTLTFDPLLQLVAEAAVQCTIRLMSEVWFLSRPRACNHAIADSVS